MGIKFQKGVSGNPKGKPVGAQNKNTLLVKLLEPHAEAIIDKLIDLAKNGDVNAIKICMDRLIAKPKDQYLRLDMPEGGFGKISDLHKFSVSLLAAVCRGEITPEQAQSVTSLVTANCKIIESAQIVARIAEIEYILKLRQEEYND